MRFASVAVAFVVAALTTDRSYLYRYDGIVPTCSIGVAQASSSLRLRPGRNSKSNNNNSGKRKSSSGIRLLANVKEQWASIAVETGPTLA
mmetsp:Transcript_16951/g.36883  ORF Transcript_16951/g.36883 Transcript_16951/m.36883 type:complete len:90 (+) Transcript_16951:214-483(+)